MSNTGFEPDFPDFFVQENLPVAWIYWIQGAFSHYPLAWIKWKKNPKT
jgi:hypothetical protein